MRKYFIFLIIIISFVFFGCKDQNSITDYQLKSPQLSSAFVDYQIKWVRKDGNGPLIEEYVSPIKWDGKSSIEPGKWYHFSTKSEFLAAYSDNKLMYEKLKEFFVEEEAAMASGKNKERLFNTKLSSWYSNVDAHCWLSGGWVHGEAYVDTGDWDFPIGIIHWLYAGSQGNGYHSFYKEYTDYQPHYNYVSNDFECPAGLQARASSYYFQEGGWNTDWDFNDDCAGK